MNTDESVLHPTQPATTRNTVQNALEASKRLQQALTRHAERLEAKLRAVDDLLKAADVDAGEDDPESEVLIPGAKKAAGLFPLNEFLNPSSPFYEEATKRTKYITNTRPHPMKAKEIEALAAAVRQENERLQAHKRTQTYDHNASSVDLDSNVEGLDWTRIAEKVSDSALLKRTPTDCRVIWTGDRHPCINHGEWPNSEIDKLNGIVQVYLENKKPVDWVNVAELLGTSRTPIDCMRHGPPQHRHKWTAEADQRLLNAVESYGTDNWQLVARKVSEYMTASQCQGRWQKSLNPNLKRGAWTTEEDELLRKAVTGYGNSWVQVAATIPGRTNDQCRERWTEHLKRSAINITWSEAEDKRLFELVESLGNKWATISSRIGNNKTGQNCRLHYEKLKKMKKRESQGLVTHIVSSLSPAQTPVTGTTRSVSNPEQVSFVSFRGPADVTRHSDPAKEGPSSSKDKTVTVNPQPGLATQEFLEIAPTKPRPKPRPRRSKKIGQAAESSNTCVADAASDAISLMQGELSQPIDLPRPTSAVDTETSSSNPHAIPAPTATTTTSTDTFPTLPTVSTRGEKKKVAGERKAPAEQESSPYHSAAAENFASSNPESIQDIEGDESNQAPLKRSREKRAPASTGKAMGVDRADGTPDLVNFNPAPVHHSEEVERVSVSSTSKKRKATEHTEHKIHRGAPKKVRVTKPNAVKPKSSTANHSEPSYDISQLRRGRSRTTLSPSLRQDSIPSNQPLANPLGTSGTPSNV